LHAAYAQHVGTVRAAVSLYGLPPDLADEVTLETFVMAHGRGEDLRTPAIAKARLCVLALRVTDSFRDEVPDGAPPVNYGVPGGTVLSVFLEGLRDRRRDMFVLAELGGLRVPEISAELGLGFDSVRSAMVELLRDFAVTTANAEAEEVLHLWVEACTPEPGALERGWQRVLRRVAPDLVVPRMPTPSPASWPKPAGFEPTPPPPPVAPPPVAAPGSLLASINADTAEPGDHAASSFQLPPVSARSPVPPASQRAAPPPVAAPPAPGALGGPPQSPFAQPLAPPPPVIGSPQPFAQPLAPPPPVIGQPPALGQPQPFAPPLAPPPPALGQPHQFAPPLAPHQFAPPPAFGQPQPFAPPPPALGQPQPFAPPPALGQPQQQPFAGPPASPFAPPQQQPFAPQQPPGPPASPFAPPHQQPFAGAPQQQPFAPQQPAGPPAPAFAPQQQPFAGPPAPPFAPPQQQPFAGPPQQPFAPQQQPFAGPPQQPFAPQQPGPPPPPQARPYPPVPKRAGSFTDESLGLGAAAPQRDTFSDPTMGAPAAPTRGAHTFTSEGLREFDSRPDHRRQRSSPLVWVVPLLLLLGGGATAGWWFFLRTPEPTDEVVADASDVPADAGEAPVDSSPALPVPVDTTPPVEPVPADTTPPTPVEPTPPTPVEPTPPTPTPTPTKTPDVKPKTIPTPKPKPKPSGGSTGGTKSDDPFEKRRDEADKADPGRVIMELEMLSAAKNALKSNPLQSIAYVDQHNKEFPSSQLTDQFDEVKIKALCGLGRSAQAKTEAANILKKRPNSRVAAAVKLCK